MAGQIINIIDANVTKRIDVMIKRLRVPISKKIHTKCPYKLCQSDCLFIPRATREILEMPDTAYSSKVIPY